MTNLFLSELLQYIGNMFKKSLNVNDTWFGFYSHFKKGTFGLPYDKCRRKWANYQQFLVDVSKMPKKHDWHCFCQQMNTKIPNLLGENNPRDYICQ